MQSSNRNRDRKSRFPRERKRNSRERKERREFKLQLATGEV